MDGSGDRTPIRRSVDFCGTGIFQGEDGEFGGVRVCDVYFWSLKDGID